MVVVLVLLAGGLMFAHLAGASQFWLAGLLAVLSDGLMAGAVVAAAAGYGHLLVRRVAPASAPAALRLLTSAVLGLWMLSTAVLAVGSAVPGALTWWVWWPVVAGGLAAGVWQARRRLEGLHLPQHLDGRALVWVLLALAVGLWLAGATRPPGRWMGLSDEYDVLEYHLQVPREYLLAGRVIPLEHNCYSFYPLGVEMLYLLAMCLRSGAYEGMYLAKLLHGAYGVLAVAGVFAALRRDDEPRARFAAALLGTCPFVIYLGWLALTELAQVCCLAAALLWLRHWLARPDHRSAACAGAMLGAACATKYLSVPLVAGPVLCVMLLASVRSAARLRHVVLAAAAAALLAAPWPVRNLAATGNPVFPLATDLLGRGHWSQTSAQRWANGHAADWPARPPVPAPPSWQPPPEQGRLVRFYYNFLACDLFGPVMLLLAGLGACVLLAERGPRDRWDLALAGVLGLQLAAWTALTWMPPRFAAPAAVPACLLAAGVLARLVRVRANPFRRHAVPPVRGPWGLAPAVAVFLAAAGVNLVIAYNLHAHYTRGMAGFNGVPGEEFTRRNELLWWYQDADRPLEIPESGRFLLLGEATAFYMPPGSIYATVFDDQPLAEMFRRGLTGEEVVAELRGHGITHVLVNWAEVWRLAATYGFEADLSAELFERFQAGEGPDLPALRALEAAGARKLALRPNEETLEQAPPDQRDRARQELEKGLTFFASLPWEASGRGLVWPRLTLYALLPEGPAPATQPDSAPAATAE